MKTNIRLAVLAILGVAGPAAWQASAAAETAAAGDTDVLTTIVVTAQKREQPLKDVPMSVTAIGGAQLDDIQARDFSDYAAMVPGLSLASSQPGFTRLTLRGQNAGGVGSTVGVYVDESPFGSSNALLNGSINTGDFDTYDLRRIEVLRGPQGTLYGANSEGGLLKFVTNPPVLGVLSGGAEVTGQVTYPGGVGADTHAVINLPFGDKVALRVSGFEQYVPGYLTDPSRGQNDINDGHVQGGRASLLFAPTESLSIRLTAESQHSSYNATNAVDVDPVTLKPLHGDLTQERFFPDTSNFKYENYSATIDWNAGSFDVLSNTSYGVLNTYTLVDATSLVLAPGTTLGDILDGAFGGTFGATLDDGVGLEKFTQEIRVASRGNQRLEWQVGGYYTHENGVLLEHLNAVTMPGGALAGFPALEIPLINSTYKEYAGFADLTFHFNSHFDLQAGGRYSRNEQSGDETITGLLVPPQALSSTSSEHVFTYSVAPRWHVDANTMIYARLATGYRPGGPNVIPPIAPPDVPRAYGADKTTNVELGIRSTQLAGRLSIDVAAYHVDWKDIQLFEVVDNTGINGNGGTARTQGVEWSVAFLPVHGLTLQWVGAYTDAKLTSPAPAVNANDGDPLPYAPKWSTSLDGEYRWAAFSNFNAFAGATWSYVGSRSTDFASSTAATPGQLELPSYNTIGLRLGIENDHYRVALFAKNLNDSRGATNYVGSGAPGLAGELTVIQPRTIGVTVGAKF